MIMKVKQNDTQCKTTGNNIGKIQYAERIGQYVYNLLKTRHRNEH